MSDIIPAEGALTRDQLSDIEHLAEGLTESECSNFIWGIEPEQLDEVAYREFKRAFTRGRTKFKLHAVTSLKMQMAGRNGLQASLAALTRFAEAWPKLDKSDGEGSYNFKIVLDDD